MFLSNALHAESILGCLPSKINKQLEHKLGKVAADSKVIEKKRRSQKSIALVAELNLRPAKPSYRTNYKARAKNPSKIYQ